MDNHRAIRQGFPEVIFCEGKTVSQATTIARRSLLRHGMLLAMASAPVSWPIASTVWATAISGYPLGGDRDESKHHAPRLARMSHQL